MRLNLQRGERVMHGKHQLMAILAFVFVFGPTTAETLTDTVQYTIDTNPDVLESSSNRLAVGEEIDQAKAGYFPVVDINLGYGWERTTNPFTRAAGRGTVDLAREEAGILLRQMLFDGFETPNEVNRQRARANSRAHTVFGRAENTGLRVTEVYLNLLRQQALVDLAKENFALHEKTHDQIRLRSERGVGRRADEDQSQSRLALAETNLTAAEGNLRDAVTDFIKVVGKDPINPAAPAELKDSLPESLDAALKIAFNNHPILQSANSDIVSAKSQHETAKAPFFPRFDLEIGAGANNNLDGLVGRNDEVFAMLRMRYNLFNGGKDIARKRETAYLINTAKEIRNNTRRQVEENVRLSWNASKVVNRQLPTFKRYQDSSEKTYDAYKQQFNIGRRTLLDVLDSANEMYLARNDYQNTRYDVLFSEYRILNSMGELNRTLQVKLPDEATKMEELDKMEDEIN